MHPKVLEKLVNAITLTEITISEKLQTIGGMSQDELAL